MPSNPTTKSQVHAYKFVLRRMQSALVRRDAVMLHDPMRTHSRATMVGVVLSALGVLGFIIFGLFKPAPEPPDSGGIVIGEDSGQVYVSAGDPQELTPTFNLASARLYLMALQSKDDDDEGGQQTPKMSGDDVEEPDVVPDDELVDIPHGKPTGIPFGPSLLPDKEQRISPQWGVCEQFDLKEEVPEKDKWRGADMETTVVAGMSDLGSELKNRQALLVRSPDDDTYLVYRQPADNDNHKNSDVVRAEVDLDDATVVDAYGLSAATPRDISNEMLDAIPEADEITPPEIADEGSDKWNLKPEVGDSFKVTGTDTLYYVLTEHGKQRVYKGVANLVAYAGNPDSTGEPGVPTVDPSKAKKIHDVDPGDPGYLDVGEFPKRKPTVLTPKNKPSACLGWQSVGKGKNEKGHTTLYVGGESPVPTDEEGESKAVDVKEASPDGYQVDHFYMPQGRAAVVRSATSKHQFGKGPIQLVSDVGVRYGVPNADIANGLGLQSQDPAPELILRLLPVGASLNMQNAQQEWPSSILDKAQGVSSQGATHD